METPKVPEPEKEPYHARIIEALFSKIVNQTVGENAHSLKAKTKQNATIIAGETILAN